MVEEVEFAFDKEICQAAYSSELFVFYSGKSRLGDIHGFSLDEKADGEE